MKKSVTIEIMDSPGKLAEKYARDSNPLIHTTTNDAFFSNKTMDYRII